ncbi:hypothetical protein METBISCDRAFT_23115 [Metschnikowia bicuspidata]|uniref:Uncharacterized protein n=1 Tax=Metschnikowia bicuspidata TaxID=27322 RepID=A0A4P9ZCQ4_9ASCO|nr:hypothetical protein METBISCDRAFT_23115 [Metschnikowia bicuspidata]
MRLNFLSLIVLKCLLIFAQSAASLDTNEGNTGLSCPGCLAGDLYPMNPQFTALYNVLQGAVNKQIQFKIDLTADLVQNILLNSTAIMIDALYLIADSPEQMNTLANYIYKFLVSALTGTANTMKALNMTVNSTAISDAFKQSGIIETTLAGLLLDDKQLAIFAANLGETMVNNTWIPELVYTFGNTGHLTFETIFNLARDSHSKDPRFNGTTYVPLVLLKRDEVENSLQNFLSNLSNSSLVSNLFMKSLTVILEGIRKSGLVLKLIQLSVGDQKLQHMIGFIANKLYNCRVFDQIPLDQIIQHAKADGTLMEQTQFILTDPTWLPPLAKIFLQWYDLSVNEQIRKNMYG